MKRRLFTPFVALGVMGMASAAQATLVIDIDQDCDPGQNLLGLQRIGTVFRDQARRRVGRAARGEAP